MALSPEAVEMVAMLGRVGDAEILEEIAQDIGVETLDTVRGDVRRLYRSIVGRINSDDFDALDDGGVAFIMAARDKLRIHLGLAAPDPNEQGDTAPKVEDQEDSDPSDSESESKDDLAKANVDAVNPQRPLGTGSYEPQPRKVLKLTGSIGKAGEKGKLTLSNLKSQIRMAQARHYRDAEICDAVIRIMSPNLDLRSYFEEQHKLTVKDLLFHLEAHYSKLDAKILFNQLGSAVMADGQTAVGFAHRLMGERDRLANLPKRERGSYSKKLIQEQFQRALYTGMRNQVARRELKALLCGDLVPTDGEIIAEISAACMVDAEHKSKLAGITASRRNHASSLSDSDDSSDSNMAVKGKGSKRKSKSASSSQGPSNNLVAELTSILVPILDPVTARVNSLSSDMERLMSQQPSSQQQMQSPQLMQIQSLGQPSQHQASHQSVLSPQLMQVQPFGQQSSQLPHQLPLNPNAPVFNDINGGQHFGRFVPPLYYNQHHSQGGRGRGRGRGLSGGSGGNLGNKPAKFRCPKCVQENAVFCNHCKTCWKIDHRTDHCPHKGDPTFVPSTN